MARNLPNQPSDDAAQNAADHAPAKATATAIPGGAPGIVPNTGDAGARNGAPKASYDAGAREGEPKQRRYMVMTGGQIMYNGVRTTIRPGKVIHAGCFDINLLITQGINLRELKDGEIPPPQMIVGV